MKLTELQKHMIARNILSDGIDDATSGYQMYSLSDSATLTQRILQNDIQTIDDVLNVMCLPDWYNRAAMQSAISNLVAQHPENREYPMRNHLTDIWIGTQCSD